MILKLLNKFKKIREKSRQRTIQKQAKLVNNSKAIKEERLAAIEFFSNLNDATIAVPNLLARFKYSLEHSINDSREKENALAGIINFGEKAIPFLRENILKSEQIAWPVKVLEKIGTQDDIKTILWDCLDLEDVSLDSKKIDKNYDILCYLRDFKLPNSGENLLFMLDVHDERIRFATTEILLKQNEESIYRTLEKFITDEKTENTRIRQAILKHFAEIKRKIYDKTSLKIGPLIGNYFLAEDYKIKIRPS
jgi:hypothetical protein